MARRIIIIATVVGVLLLATASLVAANDRAPGTPTLRWVTTGATTAEIRADGITDGGVPGNGAISWDLYFRFPDTVPAPGPGVSIVAGPAFTGMSPCAFATNVSTGMPSEPGGGGTRGVLINGFCTAGVPNNPVTGDNVLIATVTLSECPTAVPGSAFVIDFDSGDDVFGSSVSQIVDRDNDAYTLTDGDLTDGAPMCAPTAVELTNVQADSVSNPMQYGALLALALVVAIVAGAGYALRRRNAVNS
ncbi:MAG: hypothetical protein R2844_19375 [Caldilineales bacterium]